MISVKCPHCHVGLKVDEGKLPLDLTSFKCPKCKQPIPVSLLQLGKQGLDADQDTILVNPVSNGTGQLTVVGDSATPEQIFPLHFQGNCYYITYGFYYYCQKENVYTLLSGLF